MEPFSRKCNAISNFPRSFKLLQKSLKMPNLASFILFWMTHCVICDLDIPIKHPISENETLNYFFHIDKPVGFSARVKRQLDSGEVKYVYDVKDESETGDWGPWNQLEPCSRTCG